MLPPKGYSLIELTLVFIIIGILYKASTEIKSLLKISNFESLVSEVKFFEDATIKFYNIYKSLPGDLARISLLAPKNTLIPGNQDNSISMSDSQESLQFWLDLKQAGLIQGNFDGINYSLANSEVTGGIAESKFFKNLAFTIESDPNISKIILVIANYSSDKKHLASFTPSEALDIAKLLQNSPKNSNYVKIFEGEDVMAGSCFSGNIYNIKNTKKACYIKYAFSEFRESQSNENIYSKCEGSILGTIRKSNNEICPLNTEGYVKQICLAENQGNWSNYNFDCKEVKCSELLYNNESIEITCPSNSIGFNILTCNEIGILENNITNITDNCNATYNCTHIGDYRNISCPIIYNGPGAKWTQTCTNTGWKNIDKNCPMLNCGGYPIGYKRNSNNPNICPVGYNPSNVAPIEACVLTPAGADWRLIKDNCLPDYDNGNCVTHNIRTLTCPKGQMGYIEQICNSSGYYETSQDNCSQSKCENYKIGSFRIKENYTCPLGTIGQVLEICDYVNLSDLNEAEWQVSYQNCQNLVCPTISDTVGNSTWPESPANNLIEVTCSNGIDKAKRFCQPNGIWSSIADQSCP